MNPTKLFYRSIAVLAALCSLGFLALNLAAQDQPDQSAEGNPPLRAARLSYLRGNVSLQATGSNDWSQASLNYTMTTGDRMYTDQGARAEIEVGPLTVRMSEATDLTLANLTDQVVQLGLEQGSIRVRVYDLPADNSFEVDTPNGALTLAGPGDYRVDADSNGTRVIVNAGSLQVTGGGANQTVDAGSAVELTGTGPVQVAFVELPPSDSFDRWSHERDRRQEDSASARYVSRDTPGYDDLDEYGRWQDSQEYGPVWYPSVVPAGWVPYRYGHWVWVEPWGWTWVEEEPWGFCPFHYGRWAFVGGYWGWVPGPVAVVPVYAPALVAFVGGPGFSFSFSIGGIGVAAWFPLGPQEPFFPWYHFGGNYLNQVNITNIRNVTNITNITNVTNIRNINYVNRTVATTVVSRNVFSSGQPVARQVLRVTPQQLAQAQVVPHPQVVPQRSAALAGKPVAAPPVRMHRAIARPRPVPTAETATAPNRNAARPAPPESNNGRPPLITRHTPPATAEPTTRESAPPPRESSAPRNAARSAPVERWNPPRTNPPNLITRREPPGRDIPFRQHLPALQQHPGRPLEPQQERNVRQGFPPGPMRDREFPPHAAPAPRSQPQAGSAERPNSNSSSRTSKPPHR